MNEVESNHISQALGICYKSLFFIVYFHHHPELAGQRALISIKAFDCPTQQSVLLSCMMPAVMHVCMTGEGEREEIMLGVSKLFSAYAKTYVHLLFKPTYAF